MTASDWRIGIDLGGTKIEGILLAPGRTLIDERTPRERIRTPRDGGYAAIVAAIVDLVGRLMAMVPRTDGDGDGGAGAPAGASASSGADPTVKIGIGIPGTISATHGRVKNANTTELNGRALKADLEERLGRPVVCENDANCFALAEALHGAGRGARCVFGVILGTGVGGGIVLDGSIWSGAQGIAGEWGHMILDPSAAGPPCYCGRRGCVETFLCGPAMSRAYDEGGGDGGAVEAAEIWSRAARAESLARTIVERYEDRLAYALAQVVNVLDPDIVVLGGGLSNAPGLAEAVQDRIARHVFNDEIRTLVRRNMLGDSAGVLGAAWLGGG